MGPGRWLVVIKLSNRGHETAYHYSFIAADFDPAFDFYYLFHSLSHQFLIVPDYLFMIWKENETTFGENKEVKCKPQWFS